MNLEQMVAELKSPDSRDETFKLIGQVLDVDPQLVETLAILIGTPEEIKDTHGFASVLADLSQAEFIKPLIQTISQSEPGETPWLADYMYALGSILQDEDDCWQPEESFVHLLGKWVHSTGGGEIAWKSAVILSQLDHPATLKQEKAPGGYHPPGAFSMCSMVAAYLETLTPTVLAFPWRRDAAFRAW